MKKLLLLLAFIPTLLLAQPHNPPTLQTVTTAGATTNVATTFTGGLISNGAGTNSTRLGPSALAAGVSSIAIGDTASAQGKYDVVLGWTGLSKNTGGNAWSQNIAIGLATDIDNLDAGFTGNNLAIGTGTVIRGYANTILGPSGYIAGSAAAAADQANSNVVIGYLPILGLRTIENTIIGYSPTVANDVFNSISIGSTNVANHSNAFLLGNNLTSTAANDFQLGDSSALYKMAGLFPNNNSVDFGTSRQSKIYQDGTDLIINPQVSGTGILNIGPTGNKNMRVNEMGLCGTSLAGSTAVVLGTCSGSKRGVLGFSYTKNAGTGVTANIASTLTYDLGSNANSRGFNSTYSVNNGGSGTNTHVHYDTSGINYTFSPSSGTHVLKGLHIASPIAPASAAGATIYQIGVQQRGFTPFPSATAETLVGGIFEDPLVITRNNKLYFEATVAGTGLPTLLDTYMTYDNATDTRLEMTVDGVEVADFDAALPLQLNQPTNDTTVQQLVTAATNDDPTEKVRQGRVATTDATVTTINSITTTTDTALMVDCDIVARRTGGSAGTAGDIGSYHLYCSAKNVTGTVTEIAETEDFTGESQAAWDVDCAVSGTSYLLRVTGAVNNNVTWHSTCRTYEVGS